MLLPRFETDPAEVVLALGALHVVAAFVLLNRRLAGRTGLGVGDEPKAVDGRLRLRVGVEQMLGKFHSIPARCCLQHLHRLSQFALVVFCF